MVPDPRMLRRLEALVFLTVFLDLVGFGIVIPLLPFYVQSMGGSELTVGVLLGCFAFTQLLATPVLGRLSDRHGRRPIILLSLAANAVAMGLFSLASYQRLLPLLFFSRILAGATSANISACQASLADVTPPESRARAMGRLGAGIGLGLVLGPVIGGQLSEWGGAWVPPLAAGALALLGALGVLLAMPETHPPSTRTTLVKQPPRLSIFQHSPRPRALKIMLLLYFLVFLSMAALQVAFALLAQERLGWDAKEVGYVFALVGGLGLVIQGGLIGPLSKAVGEVRLLILGTLLLSVGMLGVSVAAQPLPLIGSVVLLGTGLGLTHPLLSSLASQTASPSLLGLTLGVAQSSGGLARTIGPPATGALFKFLGSSAPFTAGALLALGAAMLGALLTREGLGKHRN